jgi:exopolysaccharide production protein ExoQ
VGLVHGIFGMNTYTTGAPSAPVPGIPGGPAIPARDWKQRSLLRYMTVIDPAAMVLWVTVTSVVTVSAFGPLRYLVMAYFAAGLFLHYRQTLPSFLRGWPTLIIPVMCVISALWAPSASEAIRKGVFMFLTAAVACYAASRLSVRQILTCYFLGEILGCLMSLKSPAPVDGNWTGVFGQKNYLAVHMFILYTTAFSIVLDRGSHRFLRLAAIPFVPLTAFMVLMSHSATTLLMVGVAGMAFLGHRFLWEPASRIRHARTFLVFAMAMLGLLAVLLLVGFLQLDAMETVLKAFGKDSTLTGRTWLWAIAERTMNEHPLTGVGAAGFWRSELGAANEITRYFFYEHYVKFSFHNSFYENGVQLGYPGFYATYFLAYWAGYNALRTWMRNQTMPNATFLVLAIIVIIRANTEAELAMELTSTSVLLFIGAMRKEKPAPKPQYTHVPDGPPPPIPAPSQITPRMSPNRYGR